MAQFAKRTRVLPMNRIGGALAGVLLLVFAVVAVGCGSSKPMRFEFRPPSGQGQIEIDEGRVHSGSTAQVYTLYSSDVDKTFKLTWNGQTIYGRMDVFTHTDLTRMNTVPINITADIFDAIEDNKGVTYVVYHRHRDSNVRGVAGEDVELRVYDYGERLTRDALIEQASMNGHVIAVVDLGNSEYIE